MLDGYRLNEAEAMLAARPKEIPETLVEFIAVSLATRERRTEQRRRIEELERAQAAREMVYRATEDSTQNFAHLLNSDLGRARGLVGRIGLELEKHHAEPEALELVRRLDAMMVRLRETRPLTDVFAGLSSGHGIQTQLERFTPSDVVRLVEGWLVDLRPVLEPKVALFLRDDLESGSRGTVQCDPRLLSIVVTNLLDNAVRYRTADGEIDVLVTTEGRRWRRWLVVAVRNRGLSLAADEVARVFARGYRGERAQVVAPSGAGLGLWIGQEIMNALGGELILVPTDLNGITEARLLLPLEPDSERLPPRSASAIR